MVNIMVSSVCSDFKIVVKSGLVMDENMGVQCYVTLKKAMVDTEE